MQSSANCGETEVQNEGEADVYKSGQDADPVGDPVRLKIAEFNHDQRRSKAFKSLRSLMKGLLQAHSNAVHGICDRRKFIVIESLGPVVPPSPATLARLDLLRSAQARVPARLFSVRFSRSACRLEFAPLVSWL